jgi:hypothetical protein
VGQPHADTTWRSKIAFQSNGRAAFVAASSAGWSSGTESGTARRRCRILAPVTVKERDLQSGEEPGERKPFLRTVFVFVRAQLGGAPVGAGGARSAERARDRRLARPPDGSAAGIAESRGFRVSLKPAPGRATGATHRRHSHVRGQLEYRPRGGCETIPYVASWGEDGALDAVTKFAETIESVARRIKDALSHHGHDAAWVAHCPLEPLGIRNEPGLDGRDLVRVQVRWVVRSSARTAGFAASSRRWPSLVSVAWRIRSCVGCGRTSRSGRCATATEKPP